MAKMVMTVIPTKRFETLEGSGHCVTVHFGPEKPDVVNAEPVLDVTLFVIPGQFDWLRVGRPVRVTFERVEG